MFYAATEAIQHLGYSAMKAQQLQVMGCIHGFADWLWQEPVLPGCSAYASLLDLLQYVTKVRLNDDIRSCELAVSSSDDNAWLFLVSHCMCLWPDES